MGPGLHPGAEHRQLRRVRPGQCHGDDLGHCGGADLGEGVGFHAGEGRAVRGIEKKHQKPEPAVDGRIDLRPRDPRARQHRGHGAELGALDRDAVARLDRGPARGLLAECLGDGIGGQVRIGECPDLRVGDQPHQAAVPAAS